MKEQENLTGKGITAAVLDTGIFPHMDFDGRIVAFRDLVYGRETPYDDNGHGTHVCGILGGSGRASGGKYQGAAPGCRFVVVRFWTEGEMEESRISSRRLTGCAKSE